MTFQDALTTLENLHLLDLTRADLFKHISRRIIVSNTLEAKNND